MFHRAPRSRAHHHHHQLLIALVQEEHRIFVESEDQPNRVLLETRITKDDGYQKQQGTDPAIFITPMHGIWFF